LARLVATNIRNSVDDLLVAPDGVGVVDGEVDVGDGGTEALAFELLLL
jgi:hypothetical protein